jgi:hypothetical protein
MRGLRSDVVRKELQQLTVQLPPSQDYPLILIVFDDQAADPQLLTDRASAETAIAKLTGEGGGTRIASGLNCAADYLKVRSATQIVLLLYTDGEDINVNELMAAEDRLDRLFGERRQQGLNSSVYVKRWGNANAALVQRFIKSGNADVIDAGELSVTPLLFDPAIAIVSITRDTNNPRKLKIVLSPTVRLSDKLRSGSTPTFRFRCLRPEVNASAELTIRHDGQPQSWTIDCRSTSAEEHNHKLILPFEVNLQLGKVATMAALALPTLLTTRLEIPLSLPAWSADYQPAATIRDIKSAAWADPATALVSQSLTIAITFTSAKPLAADTACPWRITPLDGLSITAGQPEFIVSKPGAYLVPLTVRSQIRKGAKEFSVRFRCESIDGTPHRFTPASLVVEKVDLPLPPPTTCSITATVTSVGRARWIDVAQELVEFDVGVAFDTTSIVTPKERLAILYTTPIRNLEFLPDNQLVAGRSTRTLRLRARLAANRLANLSLLLEAPPSSTAIHYVIGPPLKFRVAGPPPAPLIPCIDGRPQAHPELIVSDLATDAKFQLVVIPGGLDRAAMPTPLAARLNSAHPHRKPVPDRISISHLDSIRYPLPPYPKPSFFVDQVFEIPIEIRAEPATSAVQSTTFVLRIVRQAPLRRLLFRLSVAGAALLLVGTLLLLYLRLRRAEPLRFEGAGLHRTTV